MMKKDAKKEKKHRRRLLYMDAAISSPSIFLCLPVEIDGATPSLIVELYPVMDDLPRSVLLRATTMGKSSLNLASIA